MEVISIPISYISNGNFEEKISIVNAMIGNAGKDYIFTGNPKFAWEFAWKDGHCYRREIDSFDDTPFFTLDYDIIKYEDRYMHKRLDPPEVICQCEGEIFTLRYGSYEIKARCVQCGIENTVYDG
jgi:hypothetical protein